MSAEIDTFFEGRLEELREWAAQQGKAVARRDGSKESWWLPEEDAGVLDPLDIAGMAAYFRREAINAGYREGLTENPDDVDQPSTLADCMAWTVQGDYLAAMERAYRLRQATRIRRQVWSSARYAGHGHAKGIFARLITHVQNLIAMAAPAE